METTLIQITNYLLTQSWQIAVLAIVIAAASLAMKNKSAHVRYLLWLIVLAKCLVPPLFSIPLPILPQDKQAEPATILRSRVPAVVFEEIDVAESEYVVSPSARVPVPPEPTTTESLAEITIHEGLGFGWIAGTTAFLLFAFIKALRTNRWLRRQRRQLPTELQTDIENFFTALGIGPFPKIWLLDGIGQPFVWGLPRGGIYLPANFARVDNAQNRRSVLMHELSHILRYDAMVNLLQVIVQAIFWFHPFVWWANRKLRQERERCCDETAIARLNASPRDYSSAIINTLIEERESARRLPSLAIAGPVRNIEERIKAIMCPSRKFYKRPSIIAVVSVILIAAVTVPTTLALTTRQADISAGSRMSPPDVPAEIGPDDGINFTKPEEVVPATADKQDSSTTEAFIHSNDFQTQSDELREMLQGELSSIHAGRRDDKGAEVIIAYFKSERDKRKPLVFHLAEEQGTWLIDYFYVGPFDTEKEETLRSRKKFSDTQWLRLVRSEMMEEKADPRLSTADKNPLSAVDKQIRQLRKILKGRFTGLIYICPGDEAVLAITELTKAAEGESGYLVFHLQMKGGEYRIECLEAGLAAKADEKQFQPITELPETMPTMPSRSKVESGDAKVRVEGAFDAAFQKIKQLSTAYRNRDWGTTESSARDFRKQQLEVLNKIRDAIQAYAADDYDERILRRIIEGLDEVSDELHDAIQEKKEDTMKRILWDLEVLRQDYRLLRGSKNMSWRQEMLAARVGPASCLPRNVASQLPNGTGGYALEFDGKDDFVMIPPSRSLDIHGSLTVSAWVKHSDDRHGVIVWRGDGSTNLDPYALQFTKGRIIFRMDVGRGSKRCNVVSKKPVDDQWHFWTAVCNEEAGKLHLYRDGRLEDTADIDIKFDYDTSEMWNMFGAVVLSRFTSEHFKGSIDEVRIWNVARSQDQVREYMKRSLTGTEPGLVGYWKFDEDKDDIIRNSTAYLNNGVAGKLLWDI